MSAHGETRRRAFEAACALAAEGRRPTLLSVRDRLNGRGGQKAIADGLSDWIDEAATRFAIPGVPEELRAQVVALWDLASRQADGRWTETRGALEARLAASEAAHAARLADLERATTAISAHLATITTVQAERAALVDRRDALRLDLEARHTEITALQGALDTARVTSEQLAGERDAQARRADREAQRADATKASLDAAHGQILTLQVQVGELTTQGALLEQARNSAEAALGPLREDLERMRASILERDGQVQALTSALGREQEGREADVQHWLARLEERQAEVTAARARETAWGEERQRLQEAVARLRRERHALQHPEPPPAASGSPEPS
jgi:chromosome segregation ATPase